MKEAVRSLLMHRFRSLLSVLGVVIGVSALIAMLAIGEGTKKASLEQIERLGVRNIFVKGPLSSQEQKHLSDTLPFLTSAAFVSKLSVPLTAANIERQPDILKVSPSLGKVLSIGVKKGRFLCQLDAEKYHQVCVLGSAVARQLGPKAAIGGSVRIGDRDAVIVGILADRFLPGKNQAVSERNYDETILLPLHEESAAEAILMMKNKESVRVAAPLIRRLLSANSEVQLTVPLELMNQVKKSQAMFHLVMGLIAATSLVVGGIGIANVMMASVYERRPEIGIRRALGATQQDIMRQFLTEAFTLTAGGVFIGILLGSGAAVAVSFATEWSPIVTLWSLFLSAAMALIVGLAAGGYPARLASKVDPIEALRL